MMTLLVLALVQSAAPSRVLTLAEAERVAQEHQPLLRAARASTLAAQGRVEQSRSGLLPQLSASAGYERTTDNFVFRPGAATTSAQRTSWNSLNLFDSALTASQLLWDFGQTSQRWRSTEASARAAAEQERAAAEQSLLQVRTAFFNAVAYGDLLGVARETLANQRNHLEQIEEFVRAGTRPPIDLSQARADFANAQVQVINAENAYQRSKVLLNQAIGVDGSIAYGVAHEVLPPQAGEDDALEPLVESAISERPEVAYAMDQAKAERLLVQSARGGYGPTISATAGLVQATAEGAGYTGWNVSGGVTLTWNLFQGGLTNGAVHEAQANLDNAVALLDVEKQQVRVDVEQALLAIRAAKAAQSASTDALVAARQRLALAEGRYQNGSGSVIELGDAQTAEANAAGQLVQTEFQLATARAQLVRALGRA
jgi:outer membrane protein